MSTYNKQDFKIWQYINKLFLPIFMIGIFCVAPSKADTVLIDLSSQTSITPATVEVSQDYSATITIKNENDPNGTIVDENNAKIHYHVPDNSTYSGNYSGTNWNCDDTLDSDNNLTCTYNDTLSNGDTSNPLYITLTAPSSTGSYPGIVTVEASTSDADTSNNTSTAYVNYGKSNLHATKIVSDDSVGVNQNFTYTISISNPNNSTNPTARARGVTISDTLPNGISFVSLSDTNWCSENSGTITCSSVDLAPGITKTVTVTVKATTAGTKTNTATVDASSSDYNTLPLKPNATNNVTKADITLSQILQNGISSTSAGVDSNVTYKIHIKNIGGGSADNVTLSDTLPSGATYNGYSSSSDWSCSENSGTVDCTLNDTSLANNETYDLYINVTMPSSPGNIKNDVNISTTSEEDSTTNNKSSLTTTVKGADLDISKTPDNGSTDIGTNYTYTITVENKQNLADAQNVIVTDDLDPNMNYVSDTGNCTQNGQKLTCNLGSIVSGSNKSFTVTVKMPTDSLNDVTNSVSVATSTAQENSNNTSDTATTHITGPNLNITKDANVTKVGLGKAFTYTIAVKNVNTATATNAKITDYLPSGVTITNIASNPDGWSCPSTPITGTFNCTLATFDGGKNSTIVFDATAPNSVTGSITNTAKIGHDLNASNGSANKTITVDGASFNISKVASSTAGVGDIIDYSVTVTNTSLSDEENLTITDDLSNLGNGYTIDSITDPDGWSCSGSTTLTCTRASLLSGATSTIHFKVNVPKNATLGKVTNKVSVTTDTIHQPTKTATADTTIEGADIVVIPPITTTAVANENVVFTVGVKNQGAATAKDVNITNIFNTASITKGDFTDIKVDCDGDGTYEVTSTPYTCQLNDIDSGTTKYIKISATAPNYDSTSTGKNITNNSSVVTSTTQLNTSNDSTDWNIKINGSDLKIFKQSNVDEVAANGIVTYTISLINQGDANATNIKIKDTILQTGADGFKLQTGTLSAGSDWNCSNITTTSFECTYSGSLAKNQNTSNITIQAKAPNGYIGESKDNKAVATTATAEKYIGNNSDLATVTIKGADLSIVKNVNKSTVKLGEQVTFTITVTNNDLADANDTNVTDTLPSGFTNISTNCTNGSVSGQTVTCHLGTIAHSGGSSSFTITANAPDVDGTYTNTATTSTSTPESNSNNNSDDAIVKVEGADIKPYKSAPNKVAGNSTFTYTISLKNTGNSTAYGAVIDDTIPDNNGTTYVAGSLTVLDSDWTCSLSGKNLHCNTIDSNLSIPTGYSKNIVSFQVKAGPAHYWIHNTVTTDTNTSESNTLNNSYTKDTEVIDVDLEATKTTNGHYGSTENYVGIDGDLTYKIYVRNKPIYASSVDITDVNVTDILPSNITNISVSPDSRFSCNVTGSATPGSTLFCKMKNGVTNPLHPSWSWTLVATVTAKAIDAAHFDVNNESNNYIINNYKAETSLSDFHPSNNAPTNDYLYTKTLVRGANMSIIKTAPTTVGAEKQFDYTLKIRNWPRNNSTNQHNKPSTTATNIVVQDKLPDDVNFTGYTGSGWSCSESSHIVTCNYSGTMSPSLGITKTITIKAIAPNSNGQTYTNEANVTCNTPELVKLLPDNSDDANITTEGTDITVFKHGPYKAGMGDLVTYYITVKNIVSKANAKGIYVIDTLPAGADYNGSISDSHWTYSPDANGGLRFTYDQNLSAGSNKTFSFKATLPNHTGTVKNKVIAATSTKETSTLNNVAYWSTDIEGANLKINLISQYPNPVGALAPHKYSIYARNIGYSSAKDINVTFTFDDAGSNPGWNDVNGSGTGWSCDPYNTNNSQLVCHLSSLGAHSSAPTLYITSTTPNYMGTITNSATIIGRDDENKTTTDTKSIPTNIEGADLKITKYAKDPNYGGWLENNITVGLGKEIDFKLKTFNIKKGVAKGITIRDVLPSEFSNFSIIDQGNWNCSFSSNILTCTVNSINGNTYANDITYKATTNYLKGNYKNSVDINTTTKEISSSNNHSEVGIKIENAILHADFYPTKTKVALGETFAYILDINNSGASSASDANATDILPSNITYVDSNGSDSGWSCTYASSKLSCSYLGSISAYIGTTLLKLNVKAPTAIKGVYNNDINITSSSIDSPIKAIAKPIQVVGADLLVDINATPKKVLEDRNVTYTINVKDINISTAHNINITQTFPSSITTVYLKNNGGASCNIVGNSISCSLSSLNYNQDINITTIATMPHANTDINITSSVDVNTSTLQEDLVVHNASVDVKVVPFKPVVDYRFDECTWNGTNGEVKDSASDLNGTAKNGAKTESYVLAEDSTNFSPKWRVGKFDGDDDYVEVANNPKLQMTADQTISMWVKPTTFLNSNKHQILLSKAYDGEGAIYLLGGSGKIAYYYGISSNNYNSIITNNNSLNLNKWNHICVVRDFSSMKLKWYINGIKVKEVNITSPYNHARTTGNSLTIGKKNSTNHYNFKGEIDEVEIYDIALDDKTVNDIYNNEKNGNNYNGSPRNPVTCEVDLSVTKTVSSYPYVGAGNDFIYTITVKNNSPEPLYSGFTLQDTMPPGLTINNTSHTIDVSCVGGYDFNCTLPANTSNILQQGDTRVINVSVTAPNISDLNFTNSVTLHSGIGATAGQIDPNLNNNDANVTVTTKGVDLSVTKTATPDANSPNLIHYTMTVTNLSSFVSAKGVSIIDVYDDNLTVVNYPTGINCSIPANQHYFTCTLPNIAPGSSISFTSSMLSDVNGTVVNDINVSSKTVDDNLSNNHAQVLYDINITGSNTPVALHDGFRRHVSVNNYGNMVAVGNTILQATDQNGSKALTDINTTYINVDSQPLNSSSATLNIPESNITIEYAGLYWGGHLRGSDKNDTLTATFNSIKLKTPSGNVYTITGGDQEGGDIVTDDNATGFYRFKKDSNAHTRLYYIAEANITSIIRNEYLTNSDINGIFTVSDLNVSFGKDNHTDPIPDGSSWSNFNSGFFGGWELVVIYSVDHRTYRSVRYKNSNIYDGFKLLMPRSPGQIVSLDINVSGFITPQNGDIESSLFSMVMAGDMTLPYEGMSVTDDSSIAHSIKEGSNNTNNIFNDTISLKNVNNTNIIKNLDLSYNPGIDLDQFDLTSRYDANHCISTPCYLNNGQTSTKIHIQARENNVSESDGVTYKAQYVFVNMLGFNTQIFTPDFIDSYKECFKRKEPGSLANNDWIPCSDPSQPIHRGSVVKYRVTIINSGTDDAINVDVTDALPKEVDFNGTCSSPISSSDINATNIYNFPDGIISSMADLDNNYNSTLRTISGKCNDPLYDYNQSVRDECVADLKAILIDGNETTPLDTIPDGIGETMNLIDTTYSGASCNSNNNNTTLTFHYDNFPAKSVSWIEFKTVVNSKAELGKSFKNFVSIDFTSQTLQNAGINNLQTQQSEPVDSGTVTFNWKHIVALFKDPGRNSIGTKIVNKPFDLNISLNGISSLDVDSGGNTTMAISNLNIYDQFNGGSLSDITNTLVSPSVPVTNTNLNWSTHNTNYNKASKELGFKFDLTLSYNGYTETKHYPTDFSSSAPSTTYAGDAFVTRPKEFTVSINGANTIGGYAVAKAAQGFTLNVKAVDNGGINGATRYNATLTKANNEINIALDPNFSTNNACKSITSLALNNITFNNGSLSVPNTKYDEVGVIKIKLQDNSWTAIDQANGDCVVGSGSNTGTPIGCNVKGKSSSIVFTPDHFDFINNIINDFDNNFTYMVENPSTDQVYAKVATKIISKNANNNPTQLFSNTCFGSNINVNLKYDIDSLSLNDLNMSISSESNLSNIESNASLLANNNTINIPEIKNSFANGVSNTILRVYMDKNKTTPLEPTKVNVKIISGSINNYLGIAGVNVAPQNTNIAATNDMHFIYGRAHAPNYSSDSDEVNATIYYEGYCKDCNKSKYPSLAEEDPDSVYWYINSDQNSLNDGKITNFAQPATTKLNITPGNSVAIANGKETHTIKYTGNSYPYKEKVDMNVSNWLIYDPYNTNASRSSFFVDFSNFNDWAGVGNTVGKTVDVNISSKGSKRIEW